MTARPGIGEGVRVLGNTGIPGVAGCTGMVIRHHDDGLAFVVAFDDTRLAPIVCDAVNVEVAPAEASI